MSYNWATLVLLPIVGAILIGIIYTTTLTTNPFYRVIAYLISIAIVILFIYAVASSAVHTSTATPFIGPSFPIVPPPLFDPFTYDPGESSNGTLASSQNASAFISQYNCMLKSQNTVWQSNSCSCATGFYGDSCQYQGFGDDYVSLTTSTPYTASLLPSITPLSQLTSWPIATTTAGCTNLCSANQNCVGVLYANNSVCTLITSLNFTAAPIQVTTIDPPVDDTTLYLRKSRIVNGITLPGYFNVIFGVTLPVRYFVGNGVSQPGANPVHVTADGNARVFYFPVGMNFSISGIPDFIAASNVGILYISPTSIPPTVLIVPGQGTLVALPTPLFMTKQEFPFTDPAATYFVRLDSS